MLLRVFPEITEKARQMFLTKIKLRISRAGRRNRPRNVYGSCFRRGKGNSAVRAVNGCRRQNHGHDCQNRQGRSDDGRQKSRKHRDCRPLRGASSASMTSQRNDTVLYSPRLRGVVFPPRVIICIPTDITEVEERAVIDAGTRAGARKTYLCRSLSRRRSARESAYSVRWEILSLTSAAEPAISRSFHWAEWWFQNPFVLRVISSMKRSPNMSDANIICQSASGAPRKSR